MEEEEEDEKKITNYPEPITIEGTTIILQQMKYSICKIYKANGTGFFCFIPYNSSFLRVLMTNYHVIDEKFIKENKIIKLGIYNDKYYKDISLDNNRKIYINKQYDLTIIEIKDNDKLNNDIFLRIDENLFKENSYLIYSSDKSIYTLHYPNLDKASVSYGIIKEINNKDFKHSCSTQNGSSGSPILNLKTKRVIGIHKKKGKSQANFNLATFLKKHIEDIQKNQGLKNISQIKNSLSFFPIEINDKKEKNDLDVNKQNNEHFKNKNDILYNNKKNNYENEFNKKKNPKEINKDDNNIIDKLLDLNLLTKEELEINKKYLDNKYNNKSPQIFEEKENIIQYNTNNNNTPIYEFENNNYNKGFFGNQKKIYLFNNKKKNKVERSIDDGIYNIIPKHCNNRAIDIDGAKTENLTNLQLNEYNNNSISQKFEVKYNNIDNYYIIKCLFSDKLLTVDYEDNDNIMQYDDIQGINQHWKIVGIGNNYKIISEFNEKLMDVNGKGDSITTNISCKPRTDELNQQFQFIPIKKIEFFPKTPYNGVSLVDGLREINVDSSDSNRKKIAAANGIENYEFTLQQNTILLKKLKKGILIKPP